MMVSIIFVYCRTVCADFIKTYQVRGVEKSTDHSFAFVPLFRERRDVQRFSTCIFSWISLILKLFNRS